MFSSKKTRHQTYYQNNQEKLKNKRRIHYQINKKRKTKAIQKEKNKLERRIKKWKLKLYLKQESYKYCFVHGLPFSFDKILQISEKVKDLEEKLFRLGTKNFSKK